MSLLFWIVVIAGAYGLWHWLGTREQRRAAEGLPRLSGIRLVMAVFGILLTLFSGGCGTLLLGSWIADGMRSNNYLGWEVISVFTLPPLLIGLLIWRLSMRRSGR